MIFSPETIAGSEYTMAGVITRIFLFAVTAGFKGNDAVVTAKNAILSMEETVKTARESTDSLLTEMSRN